MTLRKTKFWYMEEGGREKGESYYGSKKEVKELILALPDKGRE